MSTDRFDSPRSGDEATTEAQPYIAILSGISGLDLNSLLTF